MIKFARNKDFFLSTAITKEIISIFTAITSNIREGMKKTKLGEFEELVLLAVASLQSEAYGVEIKRELEVRLKETLSVGSIQSALKRMEEKGFLTSQFGDATAKRGGKRKRIYSTTSYARRVLEEMREIRAGLWASIPSGVGPVSPELKLI